MKIEIEIIERCEEGKYDQILGRIGDILWEGELSLEEAKRVDCWAKSGGKFRIIGDGIVKDYDDEFDFGEENDDDFEEAVVVEEWDGCQWVCIATNKWITDIVK